MNTGSDTEFDARIRLAIKMVESAVARMKQVAEQGIQADHGLCDVKAYLRASLEMVA